MNVNVYFLNYFVISELDNPCSIDWTKTVAKGTGLRRTQDSLEVFVHPNSESDDRWVDGRKTYIRRKEKSISSILRWTTSQQLFWVRGLQIGYFVDLMWTSILAAVKDQKLSWKRIFRGSLYSLKLYHGSNFRLKSSLFARTVWEAHAVYVYVVPCFRVCVRPCADYVFLYHMLNTLPDIGKIQIGKRINSYRTRWIWLQWKFVYRSRLGNGVRR